MNIQTERLDNQIARFTVGVSTERLDAAKKKAALAISKQVNIPGFRRGKVPYNVLVRYVGEQSILEDAIESLGNELYKSALDESGLDPYGPGALEEFKLDPSPTFIFTVPLQPEVQLGDYRAVRLAYEAIEVTEEDVDRALTRLQQQEASVEESTEAAEWGNRVLIDIHSNYLDGEEPPSDVADKIDEDETRAPYKGEPFTHHHDFSLLLKKEEDPILPGFSEALVGAKVGEDREFDLIVPDDIERYETIKGRRVHFHVHIKKVEIITLPELNDEFAARFSDKEDEPFTLQDLRSKLRQDLEESARRNADSAYSLKVIDKMLEGATLSYPEAMVQDQINDLLNDLDQRLRQQGITLQDYMNITGKTRDDFAIQYRERAESMIKRSLILREIVVAENIAIGDEQVDAEITRIASQFGERADDFRRLFDTPDMRLNITNDLLQSKVIERIVQIGKGEFDQPAKDSA